MKGSVRRRSVNSWELTIDLGRDAQGKRLRKFVNVSGTKRDAQRRLREMLVVLDKGIPFEDEKVTTAEWLRRWMSEYVEVNARPKTYERYLGIVERHINPRIGYLPLQKVSPSDIKGLESELSGQGMAASGVELVHTVLSGAFKYALGLEVVWRNPAQGVRPPKRPQRDTAVHEVDSVRRVLRKGRDEGHALFAALHLIAYSGIRRGEALGLRWSDVDLDEGIFTVNRSLVRTQRKGLVLQPTKTDRSRRRIDIDSDTIAVLKAHHVRQMEHQLMLAGSYEDKSLVFPDPLGRPLNPMALTRAFQGLAAKEGLNLTSLHSLRHFHASALFDQGESPLLVSRRLGHASIKTTVDIYGHLFEGAQKAAAEKFARAMREGS